MEANNPKPEGERIRRLMERIENGDIKIPKFQRNYVWKQKNIIDLLDSLYKGYPIGSLLFWRTSIKIKGERNIGGYQLPSTQETYPTNYVLDGQQRLTTIFSLFANRNNHHGIDAVFDISFDLRTRLFVPEKQANPESIPLHSLFDNKIFRAITRDFDQEDADTAADLQDIFMNYEIPIVTIFNMELEEVSTIFERINSTGKTLTIFDLMVAATWSENFDLRDEIEKLRQELDDKNYGDLGDITLLKCLSVVMNGTQNKKGIFSLRQKNDTLKSGLQKMRFGLFKAIDFLSTQLNVVSSDFLPYDFQIVLLTYFFANVSIPKSEMLKEISGWFWKSSFAERYQGANDTLLESDLDDCKKIINQNYSEVFDFTLDISVNKILRTDFKRGTAFSNAIISFLASQQPRNLITGSKIDIGYSLSSYNRKEFHHVFPKAFLKGLPITNSPNSVCNIIILSAQENKSIRSKAPSIYFKEIIKLLGDSYTDVLKSNLLPSDDISGIHQDDYDFFLEVRAELILDKIKQNVGQENSNGTDEDVHLLTHKY